MTLLAIHRNQLMRMLPMFVVLALAGCWGAQQTSPDAPMAVGGLAPTAEDKDAGRVGVVPGLNLRSYPTIAVALFPVSDRLEDEGDRRFAAEMSAFLQTELVRRLRESGLFQRVVNLTETDYAPAADGKILLRLQGTITRLGRGSQAARYFAGGFGAGATRTQAEMQFVEAPAGRVVLVTADRRIASVGFFGGSDRDHLRESFDDMARDLVKFLVRLSSGEAPRKD